MDFGGWILGTGNLGYHTEGEYIGVATFKYLVTSRLGKPACKSLGGTYNL